MAHGDERVLGRGRRRVRATRLDLLYWREEGITKGDLLDYYEAVAPTLLPHLRDRPFTFKRYYNGPRSRFEWVKDRPPEAPEWLRVAPLPAKSRGGALVRYALLNDELALLWAIDFGCVDLHVWTSRVPRTGEPDYVLFDLDPADVPFTDVVRAARLLRDALDELGLASVPKTTGGEGIHVHVPLARRHTYPEVRRFADVVAGALARSSGGIVTKERALAPRHGVFVDTKMNGHGEQVAAAYSVRPRAGAPVATPLRWDEVEAGLDPLAFTMDAVCTRIERDGAISSRRRSPAASASTRPCGVFARRLPWRDRSSLATCARGRVRRS